MLRRTKILLRIVLSVALVLGGPLGTFQSAEAQTKCAERTPSVDYAPNASRIAPKTAADVRINAAQSIAQKIHAVYQNALDCFSECIEDGPNGSLARVDSAEPDKSKEYVLVSSIVLPKRRSERFDFIVQPSANTLPEDTILRTMRWRI